MTKEKRKSNTTFQRIDWNSASVIRCIAKLLHGLDLAALAVGLEVYIHSRGAVIVVGTYPLILGEGFARLATLRTVPLGPGVGYLVFS